MDNSQVVVEMKPIFDAHTHQREGKMMELIVPLIAKGGVDTVLVMPNTQTKITSAKSAIDYKGALQKSDPTQSINFLMSLYLNEEITTDTIEMMHQNGIKNIKSYPHGVTTGSDSGVVDLKPYYDVFKLMEEKEMILNLHCEAPTDRKTTFLMNAETMYIPVVQDLLDNFKNLKIIVEHTSSYEMVDFVRFGPDNLAATITIHHLECIIDDCVTNLHNLCKPVPKGPRDLAAVRQAAFSQNPKFFFGSDSAPHPESNKLRECPSCGVFTAPDVGGHLFRIFAESEQSNILENFACVFGRQFYGLDLPDSKIKIGATDEKIPNKYGPVVPYRAGLPMVWKVL